MIQTFLNLRPEALRDLKSLQVKEALVETEGQLARSRDEVEKLRQQIDAGPCSRCASHPSRRLSAVLQESLRHAMDDEFKAILTKELLIAQQEADHLAEVIGNAEARLGLRTTSAQKHEVKKRRKKVTWRRRVCRSTSIGTTQPVTDDSEAPVVDLPCPSQEEQARILTLSKVHSVCDQAKTMAPDHGFQCLTIMKDQLCEVLQASRNQGIMEEDLVDIEKHRRRIHNIIEDLKGQIRVYCRFRPLSNAEMQQGNRDMVTPIDSMSVQVGESKYAFDAVFHPFNQQEEIFADCSDLIQSAIDGYNITLFAYGQTGAGKTYTMFGRTGEPGLAPRIIEEIFKLTGQNSDRFSYTVSASMLELYRNCLVDLLHKGSGSMLASRTPAVRTDRQGSVYIENVIEKICQDSKELESVVEMGHQTRTVAATAMNSESSRSHLILTIKVLGVNKETKEKIQGKVLLVDLAGSERLKKSQVTGDMQKEAIEINKSLTALGDVMEALTQRHKQVPYRNHKLTQVMQDSLGGKAKTLMFVNCSPAESNQEETHMSLKYASRAKKITKSVTKATL
jgi:hypothetical protein